MYKKFIVLVVALFGLATFFVPLVRVQAPVVGTQRISAWDAVKPGEPRKQRNDLGLSDSLDRIQGDFLRQKQKEAPLAVKQAYALAVTLPLSYLALLLGAGLVFLRSARPLQITSAVGVLAGGYSLVSVFWLAGGVKEMVAGSPSGSKIPIFGSLRKSVAAQVEVTPETGLYLLVAALAALLLASLLPAGKR